MGSAWILPTAAAKGEYNSRRLYTRTRDGDTGGIVLALPEDSPVMVLAAAVGRRKGGVYRATVDGAVIRLSHLPVDIYDLLLVGRKDFFEGLQLVRRGNEAATAREREAIRAEVAGIEGFFDSKKIHRLEIAGTAAVALVQQWRTGVALAESGARLRGTIHSLDLICFAHPLKGWQLVRRRQLYRDEIGLKTPLAHHHVPALGKIRVTGKIKDLGRIALE